MIAARLAAVLLQSQYNPLRLGGRAAHNLAKWLSNEGYDFKSRNKANEMRNPIEPSVGDCICAIRAIHAFRTEY